MTKYEWESELRKNIHRLPQDEIERVLEYYDELFADKIERGYRESEIVGQFGNPVDVADKILSEYEGELLSGEPVPTPKLSREKPREEKEREERKREQEKPAERPAQIEEIPLAKNDPPPVAPTKSANSGFHGDRLLAFVLINVFTGFTFFIVIGVVWIVAASLTIAGGAMAVGGVAAAVWSFTAFGASFGSGLAQLGMSIALCGLGILLLIGCIKIIKLLGVGMAKLFGALGRWICPKQEVIV